MIDIQIIGIRKPGGADNAHEAISHYQWGDPAGNIAIWTREQVLEWMDNGNGQHRAYVLDYDGKMYCRIITNRFGTRFLQTYSNGQNTDNLLNLPQI